MVTRINGIIEMQNNLFQKTNIGLVAPFTFIRGDGYRSASRRLFFVLGPTFRTLLGVDFFPFVHSACWVSDTLSSWNDWIGGCWDGCNGGCWDEFCWNFNDRIVGVENMIVGTKGMDMSFIEMVVLESFGLSFWRYDWKNS